LAVFALAWGAPALGADEAGDIAKALVHDAEFTAHFRTYYLDRRRPPGQNESEAWAGGGWLGYQSGWLGNALRLGVVGYTSQPIWAPPETDGTLLLKPGQDGYSVWGQAYVALKAWDQVFTAYRQMITQPEVNPRDIRMTPNTFEAYALTGKVGRFGYFAGYVDKIKPINSDKFIDMAEQAGAPAGVKEGMWLGTVDYKPVEQLGLRLSSYHVSDILNSTYTDATWRMPLAKDTELRLSGQYMYQTSTGSDLLTGSSFKTHSAGLKGDLQYGPATFTLAYTQVGRGQQYRHDYGSWAGYTSMIVEDFDEAGRRAWLAGGAYDFARHGAPGLSAFFNLVFGSHAINAATGAPVSDKDEYDLTLDYRFSAKTWPEWLRPLWLRGRWAHIEQKQSGTTSVTDDYRIIVNYEWVFK
jgi:hypothetical protein